MSNIVAVYGGAFDPFHKGHQYVMQEVKSIGLKKIIIVPTGSPVFEKELIDSSHRINLIKATAIGDYVIEDFELKKTTPSYTFNTIQHLKKKYKNLVIVIGEDNLFNIKKWYRLEDLLNITSFLVIGRHSSIMNIEKFASDENLKLNFNTAEITNGKKGIFYYHVGKKYNISSSEIRQFLKLNHTIETKKHLTEEALAYIKRYNLYQ
ncbi:MAG: nicotinate (nicotinamide) nucleotide adenylyltransferase [Nitrosomonadales bacterium]